MGFIIHIFLIFEVRNVFMNLCVISKKRKASLKFLDIRNLLNSEFINCYIHRIPVLKNKNVANVGRYTNSLLLKNKCFVFEKSIT